MKKAAEYAGISYRTVQAYISRMERNLGVRVVATERGGSMGGGRASLTGDGKRLLEAYRKAVRKHRAGEA